MLAYLKKTIAVGILWISLLPIIIVTGTSHIAVMPPESSSRIPIQVRIVIYILKIYLSGTYKLKFLIPMLPNLEMKLEFRSAIPIHCTNRF